MNVNKHILGLPFRMLGINSQRAFNNFVSLYTGKDLFKMEFDKRLEKLYPEDFYVLFYVLSKSSHEDFLISDIMRTNNWSETKLNRSKIISSIKRLEKYKIFNLTIEYGEKEPFSKDAVKILLFDQRFF